MLYPVSFSEADERHVIIIPFYKVFREVCPLCGAFREYPACLSKRYLAPVQCVAHVWLAFVLEPFSYLLYLVRAKPWLERPSCKHVNIRIAALLKRNCRCYNKRFESL